MIIGTGVDITEVRRLRRAVERWGDSFLTRVFTPRELEHARSHSSFYQHLAGRFAAKEAVFKALGDRTVSWQNLQITNDPDGRPSCALLNRRARGVKVLLSISHVKTYAVASAVVFKEV